MRRTGRASTLGLGSWALYDWANNGFGTIILTFVFAPYFTEKVAENPTLGSNLWGNMLSACNVVVALCGPALGAFADQTGRRKPWLAGFTLLCVGGTASLWFVRPDSGWVLEALLLCGVALLGSLFAMIFYNAMLPSLADDEHTGRWSGWGWGLGYLGGLACLGVAWLLFLGQAPLVPLEEGSARDVRAVFLLSAAWYLVFSLPLMLFTPDAPRRRIGAREAVARGLGQLRSSVTQVRRYGHLVRFLVARMLYKDGLSTIFAFGGIYAAGTFGLDKREVLLFGVLLSASAGFGALVFARVDDLIGPRQTILIGLTALLGVGAVLVFTTSELSFWIFGGILGLFFGPVEASSRSYLARTAPAELRTQFFGLYALSGKLTAFAGPLVVGWVTWLSGSQRIGLSTVMVFLAAGGVLLLGTPRARQAADEA